MALPDYLGAWNSGVDRGAQRGLAQLFGQAMQAPREERPGLIAKMAGTDPQSAIAAQQSFGEMDDDKRAQVARHAQLFSTLPDEQKVQAYPQLAAEVGSLTGQQLPNAYDAKFLPMIQQVASWNGGGLTAEQQNFAAMTGQFTPEQIAEARMIQAGLKPRAGLLQVGEYAGGVYGINRDPSNPQALPVGIGGAQQPPPQQGMQAGMYQTPGGMVRVGNDMSPEDAATIQADVANGGQADQYVLPPRDVSPQQRMQGGGQLQGKGPSPLQVQAAQRAEEAAQRAAQAQQEAAAARARGNAPAGHRFRQDGSLEKIPGFEGTIKPPTQAELTAKGYHDRMQAAETDLAATVAAGYDPGNYRDYATAGQGPLLNWAASDMGQQYRQKQEDWVRAKLRKESGAVIGDDEMEREIKVYFPQPGDGANVIRKKGQSRKIAIQAMREAAGRAAKAAAEDSDGSDIDSILDKYR